MGALVSHPTTNILPPVWSFDFATQRLIFVKITFSYLTHFFSLESNWFPLCSVDLDCHHWFRRALTDFAHTFWLSLRAWIVTSLALTKQCHNHPFSGSSHSFSRSSHLKTWYLICVKILHTRFLRRKLQYGIPSNGNPYCNFLRGFYASPSLSPPSSPRWIRPLSLCYSTHLFLFRYEIAL